MTAPCSYCNGVGHTHIANETSHWIEPCPSCGDAEERQFIEDQWLALAPIDRSPGIVRPVCPHCDVSTAPPSCEFHDPQLDAHCFRCGYDVRTPDDEGAEE